jgi:hypothetical protein
MWEPRRLTTLWASRTRYRDSFTFFTVLDVTFKEEEVLQLEMFRKGQDASCLAVAVPAWRSKLPNPM